MGEEPTTNIRRVGLKDRKTHIEKPAPLFAREEPAAALRAAPEPVRDVSQRAAPVNPHTLDRYPPIPPARPPQSRRKPQAAKGPRFSQLDAVALLFVLASCGVVAYVAYLWQNPWSALNLLPPPTLPPIFVTATPAGPPPRFGIEQNTAFYSAHPGGAGCDAAFIGGRALTTYPGLQVRVTGDNATQTQTLSTLSSYGNNGYEFALGNPAPGTIFSVALLTAQGESLAPAIEVVISESCGLNLAIVNFVEVR